MAAPPQLSVLTVAHRRPDLLARKTDSLLGQTLEARHFEWLVLLNGFLEQYQGLFDGERSPLDVRILRCPRPVGVAKARNLLAREARGEVLYLSDDDCLLPPDALQRHLEAQEGAPGVWLGGIRFETPERCATWAPRRVRYWNLNGANSSLPAKAFARVGGFAEDLEGYGGEDLLLGYRLQRAGLAFRPLPGPPVRHIGPDPHWGRDLAKARSAGANAVRIGRNHPELAIRLGIHPLLLALKKPLLERPLGPLLARLAPGWHAYEQAYLRGALEAAVAADLKGAKR